jgi:choline-sulfatase
VRSHRPKPPTARALATTALLALGLLRCSQTPAAGRSDAATDGAAMRADATPASPAAGHAEEAHGPPADLNVILLTLDSFRADMPWAGYSRPIAPNLTAFAEKGVNYTHAYSLSSYTSMSLGGLLGGKYPGEMKRDGYFFGHYRGNTMFPERLQAAGIKTFAVHAHLYFRMAGFERGFDVYKLVPGLIWNANTDENVTSPRSEKMAEKLLADPALTSGRFFAWFHFLDPHDQYKRHTEVPSYGRRARDLYDGEIAYTDIYIGKLLEFIAAQPWAAHTAIIVSGDHGEAFGEHQCWRHGFEVWQPLVRVPWIFAVPGARARTIDVNRSHLDMAPTILDLLGVSHEGMAGTSLVSELYGKTAPEPRDVIVDLPRTSNNDRRRALVHDHYKLISFGDDVRYQLFDLDADPDESQPLNKVDRPKFLELVGLYKAEQQRINDVGPYACRTLEGAPPGRAY